ncbi:hypothetical protein NE237_025120 [Protea cynaroides]|uniref:SNRNP25 ubiquitin-like domain-containing protein n=1 Tax=Protea cynaroides TaxID=273540 RepID=A0A9Q0JZ75_9MAGN|nr:hypothetical protein NE237_025120 [Protea cynaroides]
MPSIGQYDSRRFSFDGFQGDSSPTFIPLCHDVSSRLSFSYHKLPQQLFKLSILKLDGSSFDVQVARTGSVADLKQAIEDFFNFSPKEDGGQISWSHVWGHFCLSFEGQKLLNDKAYIRSFGIRDGDQLCFIRHLSINQKPIETSKSCKVYNEQETIYSSGLNSPEKEEQRHEKVEDYDGCYGDKKRKDMYFRIEDGKNQDNVRSTEFKLAEFVRGWFSNSKLWGRGKPGSHSKAHLSRFESLESWDEGDSHLKVITLQK